MSEQVTVNITNGGPVRVYVKDGKIVRIRPLVLDETDAASWTINAHGKKFTPPRKTTLAAWASAERARVYSDDRIKYPLKRVDFDPNGDRHPETRGKSPYERISWDEALDMVASEMKRVRTTYGKEAISAVASSHHNWGNVGYRHNAYARFFDFLGYTDVIHDPESPAGWMWGPPHNWGFYWRVGSPEPYDVLEDVLQNSDLIVFWSNDPDTIRKGYPGQESAIWRNWFRELGKKMVFIDPLCNYTAALMADKWLAPRPGTDTAMAAAIAYVWITDGTYDKDYIANRTLGFDEFKKYIMGESDGVAKTPKWAEEISAVPAREITALAREWASKRTSLSGVLGSASRRAYGHEYARFMVLLQAMQGLGKPGVNVWEAATGGPVNTKFKIWGYADQPMYKVATKPAANPVSQRIYRLQLPDAVLNPPIHWRGEGYCFKSIEQQMIPYSYPEPGCSEIKLFYRYGGSFLGTMTEGNKWVKMYQSPKLEFIVNQDCFWCTETRFADIILPACTNLERDDIAEWTEVGGRSVHSQTSGCNHAVVAYQQKCIEPLYESRSDYQIFTDLAERLGFKEDFTDGGKTEHDWIKLIFDASSLPDYISFEDFKKKGYFIVPIPEDYKSTPALRWFYEGRDCDTPDANNPKRGTDKAKELGTYSGKLEFVSQSLMEHFPDDEERPPLPHYIPDWEGHTSELTKKYPLQLMSPHPRFSHHTLYDHIPWLWDIPGHRKLKDGYYYQTVRIHPSDAEMRGIKNGDVVKLYNDRGAVLGIAQLTERIKPGVAHSYEGSGQYDPLEPGKPYTVDKGGCINILSSSRMMSQNAYGMAPNSCLVEISKWEV